MKYDNDNDNDSLRATVDSMFSHLGAFAFGWVFAQGLFQCSGWS